MEKEANIHPEETSPHTGRGRETELLFLPNNTATAIRIATEGERAKLWNLFLSAYNNKTFVHLSQAEEICNDNKKNISIPSKKKLRIKSMEAIRGLRRLIKETDWTIFSPEDLSFCLIEKSKIPPKKEEKKKDPAKIIYILPDGQQYVTKSPIRAMCLEMALQGRTLENLQQELTKLSQKNLYVLPRMAKTEISLTNGRGLQCKGWEISVSELTADGKLVHPLRLLKITPPTSSPERKSLKD